MHYCELWLGLAKIDQDIITGLPAADGLNRPSVQYVTSGDFTTKFCNSAFIVLGRHRPPRNTPLNLEWVELCHTRERIQYQYLPASDFANSINSIS